jgi:sugar phosphate isomerase/epimerase
MIFVSTGGVRKKSALDVALDYFQSGILNIELSGGQHDVDFDIKFQKITKYLNLQIHNYFPPPKNPYVFNLASDNPEITKLSIDQVRNGIYIASMLDRKVYSFHAGFRINPAPQDLGKGLARYKLMDRSKSLQIFRERILILSEEANKLGVQLLIENNVLTEGNFLIYGEDPLLFTGPDEIIEFMRFSPINVGLLMDVAHLKVSAKTLNFSKYKAHEDLLPYIKAYHLSDNDGKRDSNQKVTSNSWFWDVINKSLDSYTLEIYGLSNEELKSQYFEAAEYLSRRGSI